jgi:hypothetical protein
MGVSIVVAGSIQTSPATDIPSFGRQTAGTRLQSMSIRAEALSRQLAAHWEGETEFRLDIVRWPRNCRHAFDRGRQARRRHHRYWPAQVAEHDVRGVLDPGAQYAVGASSARPSEDAGTFADGLPLL